jgi:glycosyltransferase involved in cell wall biosynthesis
MERCMQISCVVVCYNQVNFIEETLLSVVKQTRPPTEILVADDGSTDGSRELIQSLAASHPIIRPIFRERNLGVTMNRDLALRQASGDFVTSLDGDDYFLPTKLEKESEAIERTSSLVAFSDLRVTHMKRGWTRTESLAPFETLDTNARMRWIVSSKTHIPRDMLVARDLHMCIGGYNHDLKYYEDWDYKIRLAAQPGNWIHSGVEGVVIRLHGRHGGGLSRIPYHKHGKWRLAVLSANKNLVCGHLGRATYYGIIGRTVAWSIKWQLIEWRMQAHELRHKMSTSDA